ELMTISSGIFVSFYLIWDVFRRILRDSLVFFTAPPPAEIYALSLHDALPISHPGVRRHAVRLSEKFFLAGNPIVKMVDDPDAQVDRKSTRLNSSHRTISYAVFCLKKKKNNIKHNHQLDSAPHLVSFVTILTYE